MLTDAAHMAADVFHIGHSSFGLIEVQMSPVMPSSYGTPDELT